MPCSEKSTALGSGLGSFIKQITALRPAPYHSPFQLFGIDPGQTGMAEIRQARRKILAEYELVGNENSVSFSGTALYRNDALQLLEELENSQRLRWHARIACDPALLLFLTQKKIPDSQNPILTKPIDDSSFVDYISPFFRFRIQPLIEENWNKLRDPQQLKEICSMPMLMTQRDLTLSFGCILRELNEKSAIMMHAWESLRWRPHYFSEKQCYTFCNPVLLSLIDQLPDFFRDERKRYHTALLDFLRYLIEEQKEWKFPAYMIRWMNDAQVDPQILKAVNQLASHADIAEKEVDTSKPFLYSENQPGEGNASKKDQPVPSLDALTRNLILLGCVLVVAMWLYEKMTGVKVYQRLGLSMVLVLYVTWLVTRIGKERWYWFLWKLILAGLLGLISYAMIRAK